MVPRASSRISVLATARYPAARSTTPLTFRLRHACGNNEDNLRYTPDLFLSLDHPAFWQLVYDGRISRLYVDGRPVAHADLEGEKTSLTQAGLSPAPPGGADS